MPFVGSSTFGEKGLKSSWKVPAAPVVIVSKLLLLLPGDGLVLLPPLAVPPLLLPQAASSTAAAMAVPVPIIRTRQGLDDISGSFFLSPWVSLWCGLPARRGGVAVRANYRRQGQKVNGHRARLSGPGLAGGCPANPDVLWSTERSTIPVKCQALRTCRRGKIKISFMSRFDIRKNKPASRQHAGRCGAGPSGAGGDG